MRFVKQHGIAVVALVFAMTGTGIAASRYLVTSTAQIKPSVRRELRAEAAHAAEAKLAKSGAHAVVDRVHLGAPFTITAGGGESQEVTGLTGASWTQRAEETQGVIEGSVHLFNPGKHECGVLVTVFLDGIRAAEVTPLVPAGQSITASLRWHVPGDNPAEVPVESIYWLPESEGATEHQVHATAALQCSPNPEPVRLEQLRLGVVGLK